MEIAKTIRSDNSKAPFKKSFVRSQIVSLTATTVDFTVSLILNYIFSVYYVTATTIGSLLGSVTSFNLGRNWAFISRTGKIKKQAFRFMIISVFSIFINTSGVFYFKENFHLSFLASRILVSILIGVFFNFLMNRYFVFK